MKYLDPFRCSLEITNISKYVSDDYFPKRGVIPQKKQTEIQTEKTK